jgi:hypothetical protein
MTRWPDSHKLVDLRRQDEIRFGEPVYRMRPSGDLDLAPTEEDIGMMALLLGELANSIYERQGGLEIGKLVGTYDVMIVDDIPLCGIGQLPMNVREIFPLERRDATATGHAIFVS